MRTQSPTQRDKTAATIADRQWGMVTHNQLLTGGLTQSMIQRSVEAGRLWPQHRGVYSVGHRAINQRGRWMAAVLACGDGAVLSHWSAAALWEIRAADPTTIHVLTRRDGGRKRRGIRVRRTVLEQDAVTRRYGIPTTTPGRTLVDLAGVLSARDLRYAVERAQDQGLFDRAGIATITEGGRKLPGVQPLRDLITLMDPCRERARSHLEREFLRLCRRAKLPLPLVNVRVGGRERDFVWPEHKLVVETDGYRYHSSRKAQRRDRARDRELMIAGWRPARFTYEDVIFDPASVAAQARLLLR